MTEIWIWGKDGMVNQSTRETATVATTYVSCADYDQLGKQYQAAAKAAGATAQQLLRLRALCKEIFSE